MHRKALKRMLANWLLLAELDFRLAQRTYDGSARARRRYRWAREQLRLVEWEAALLLSSSRRPCSGATVRAEWGESQKGSD